MGKTLLLEIGTEELPSSFVDSALAALPALAQAKLAALRLPYGDIHALGTPRRLALFVHDLAEEQPDLDEQVVGPPEAVAFKDGKPTKAAEAFAAKLGIDASAVVVADCPASGKQKAGRYAVGRRREKGRDARDLLGHALGEICTEIPFRKSMRWGSGEATFGRPVQWLVALLGESTIDVAFAGVHSARTSRGHRFLCPVPIEMANADEYVTKMRDAHVLVDRDEREKVMMDRVLAAAKAAGGTYDTAADLVSENASLVEEPHVVTGRFDTQFLALPAAVIRAVARGHQKYFCVQKSDTELLPSYLAVVNTANDPARIVKGMNRVMQARLSDAKFFFDEDKKAKLIDRVEKLAGITFHHRLGTVREKVTRIEKLVATIARAARLSDACTIHAKRAAHLCKFDLVSLMVSEFPELQGNMGREYAAAAGEPSAVANAIADHYRPIGADGPAPADDISACIAIADRLDTLAGCFAVGLSPTGATDPFALRRACIGVLRTILERGTSGYASLSLQEAFGWAYDGFEGKKFDLSRNETIAKLSEFAHDRVRGLLASATTSAVADAVASAGIIDRPSSAMARARALHHAVVEGRAWLDKARIVAKRLSGISKEKNPILHDNSVFVKADDALIVNVVTRLDAATKNLETEAAVTAALAQAEDLAQRLDDVFAKTLVNDPNDTHTPKRLELLSYGAACMLRIGDFSKLS
ncbi:MAG: glycine--tRNA ligase subunit beta [Polyangiaceae bacterium]|nr:glycine--tRNA ligase subunit beta [Polyangiaceae bacterium]